MIKKLAIAFVLLFAAQSQATNIVVYTGQTGLTGFALKVQTAANTYVSQALTEGNGTSNGSRVGQYFVTEAQVATAVSNTASTGKGYSCVVEDGSGNPVTSTFDLPFDGTHEIAVLTVLGTPAHTTIAGDIAAGGGGSTGGPFLQRKIGPAHLLTAKDGSDGNFGVIGSLNQKKSTGPITWAIELAGTQVPAGATIDSMSAPVLSGADSSHATVGSVAGTSYGTNNTRLLFEFTLSSSATTADVINITIPFAPNAGESNSITIPVTVSN